ncbi:MAG: hypothetical protein IJ769_13250, partial [Clostridia bacterium]|nr:hypothetical protein [Clostridia bacterium]
RCSPSCAVELPRNIQIERVKPQRGLTVKIMFRELRRKKRWCPKTLVDGRGTVHGILNGFPLRRVNDVAL